MPRKGTAAKPPTPRGGRPAVGPPVHLRLPEELAEAVDAYATSRQIARSTAIRELLVAGLAATENAEANAAVTALLDALTERVVARLG